MDVRNFEQAAMLTETSHRGLGLIRSAKLYAKEDFASPLRFLYYVEIPPGASIGVHTHKADEEMYIILSGRGQMTVDGEIREVGSGDMVLNKPFGSHGLYNHSDDVLKLLIFEAALQA
ncbi:cupin domain-containing protein [Paenibacillus whitsoniae]|uniref:Cupin domain-containing protein n=1 Tax=Paenibacillus whitsoniae TaxID=2496558 RepID=A0A3S0AES4_9BACL|nr:cupin domain-containing protein [Paenibacillus whitsoniae]RTE11249.1 cupin domain-containing protein [Paenibacillus whitsoniae]